MALQRSDGGINRCSFATDQEGGFTDAQIARLDYLRPYVSIMAEVHGRAQDDADLAGPLSWHQCGPPYLWRPGQTVAKER